VPQAIEAVAVLDQDFTTALEQGFAVDDLFRRNDTDRTIAEGQRFGAQQYRLSILDSCEGRVK